MLRVVWFGLVWFGLVWWLLSTSRQRDVDRRRMAMATLAVIVMADVSRSPSNSDILVGQSGNLMTRMCVDYHYKNRTLSTYRGNDACSEDCEGEIPKSSFSLTRQLGNVNGTGACPFACSVVRSFVRSFVRSSVRSLARSLACNVPAQRVGQTQNFQSSARDD